MTAAPSGEGPMGLAGAVADVLRHDRDGRGSIDLLRNARAAQVIGADIAARLHAVGVDTILIWDEVQSGILAYIVAEHLPCRVLRAYESNGLLWLVDDPDGPGRIAIVADAFESLRTLEGLLGLARAHQLQVVSIITVRSGCLGVDCSDDITAISAVISPSP